MIASYCPCIPFQGLFISHISLLAHKILSCMVGLIHAVKEPMEVSLLTVWEIGLSPKLR